MGSIAQDIRGLINSHERQVVPRGIIELLEIEMVCRTMRRLTNETFRKCPCARRAPGYTISCLLSMMLGTPSSGQSSKFEVTGSGDRFTVGGRAVPQDIFGLAESSSGIADLRRLLPASHAEMWKLIVDHVAKHYRYNLFGLSDRANGTEPAKEEAKSSSGTALFVEAGKNSNDTTTEGAAEVKLAQGPQGNALSPPPLRKPLDSLSLLRRFCQLMGVQVASRDYDFLQEQPVEVEDVVHIAPVVKHAMPRCPFPESNEPLRQGRLQLKRGHLAQANQWVQESLMFLYQIVGPFHHDVAVACATQAM